MEEFFNNTILGYEGSSNVRKGAITQTVKVSSKLFDEDGGFERVESNVCLVTTCQPNLVSF
jgi:hypothetical protein